MLNPLPVSQSTLCSYVAYLARQGLAPTKIKVYLSALRHAHIARDISVPQQSSMPKLKLVQQGITRTHGFKATNDKRLPITPAHLRLLRTHWGFSSREHNSIMLWAAATLAFFGFFRIGELTLPEGEHFSPAIHLSPGDVGVNSKSKPTMLQVHLKRSKTVQDGSGVTVYIGATHNELCPVGAVLAYLVTRGSTPGPLFQFRSGKPLTRRNFTEQVRLALTAMGVNSRQFAGHSFRIGAATTAAECGLEDSTIKALGRWNSEAYQTYIRIPQPHLAALTSRLAQHNA